MNDAICPNCGNSLVKKRSRPPKYCDKSCASQHRERVRAKPIIERLLAQRRLTSAGCWEWTGAVRPPMGYGTITINNTSHSVHRISYEIWRGPIPRGMCACHSCDNPPCFNPAHLWLGTKGDNNRDSAAKGRAYGFRASGENNPGAVLSNAQAANIRRLKARGMKQRDIAREFEVSEMTVSEIVNNKTYKESLR